MRRLGVLVGYTMATVVVGTLCTLLVLVCIDLVVITATAVF